LEIKKLGWDSGFLGREVFSAIIDPAREDPDVNGLVRTLQQQGAGLAYLHLSEKDASLDRQLTGNGAILYDEKVTYAKTLGPVREEKNEAGVEAYRGSPNEELIRLALLAGHDSRFRKDPRLLPFFEPLYKLWMVNSLKGTLADIVYIYKAGTSIKGMVTCKVMEDGTGNIGLIATRDDARGQGVGARLIRAADAFFRAGNAHAATVVTQSSNVQACRFYEKMGFTPVKKEYIYHLWF
jgi:dTDP-4-amino-4,6-dideoxy-D-galactose acyltransferase